MKTASFRSRDRRIESVARCGKYRTNKDDAVSLTLWLKGQTGLLSPRHLHRNPILAPDSQRSRPPPRAVPYSTLHPARAVPAAASRAAMIIHGPTEKLSCVPPAGKQQTCNVEDVASWAQSPPPVPSYFYGQPHAEPAELIAQRRRRTTDSLASVMPPRHVAIAADGSCRVPPVPVLLVRLDGIGIDRSGRMNERPCYPAEPSRAQPSRASGGGISFGVGPLSRHPLRTAADGGPG